MNHFIVRQRQHKMLAVGIHLVESQLVVVVFAEYRIEAEIVQRVVHEAQIPFEIKTQSAVHQMLRHFRERGGFFSDHQCRWHALVNDLIEFFDKGNGFDVVAAALLIRLPLTFRARIVQVQHGGHRVHAQTIQMVVFEPEQGVVDEKSGHFAATKVINRRIPIGMKTATAIRVFVQRCTVEHGQAVCVGRKMRRNPVENHADAIFVRVVDQPRKTVGRAKARSRRVHAHRLITPRRIQRMLGHRHNFNMGKAQIFDVGDQAFGQLVVGEEQTVFIALPRTQMHFINADRLNIRVDLIALRQIVGVIPCKMVDIEYFGRIGWT